MKLEMIAASPLKTIYRDGDKVVRVLNGALASDVLRQALNLSLVVESGVKAPGFIGITKVDENWALVAQYIPGKTLEQLMQKNPDRLEEYMNRFIDIQLNMHSHTAPGLKRLTEKLHGKISASGLDATARYELHTRLNGIEEHNKLCHGDFNPSNIIITENDEAYIIDWAHATKGNASADAAKTYLLFWLDGNIKGAELYMKLFCKKSDTARQYVDKWISIFAASRLGIGKPEEREFLLNWANIADYE